MEEDYSSQLMGTVLPMFLGLHWPPVSIELSKNEIETTFIKGRSLVLKIYFSQSTKTPFILRGSPGEDEGDKPQILGHKIDNHCIVVYTNN